MNCIDYYILSVTELLDFDFISDFLKSIIGLFRNKLYVVIVFGKCILLITISGGIVFGPKYMETQFTLPAWKSNLLIGIYIYNELQIGLMNTSH